MITSYIHKKMIYTLIHTISPEAERVNVCMRAKGKSIWNRQLLLCMQATLTLQPKEEINVKLSCFYYTFIWCKLLVGHHAPQIDFCRKINPSTHLAQIKSSNHSSFYVAIDIKVGNLTFLNNTDPISNSLSLSHSLSAINELAPWHVPNTKVHRHVESC